MGLPAYFAATGFGVTGKNSAIHADAVATDAAGNTVVVGAFRGTATFGTATSGVSFTSSNTQDTFVARYSAAGTLVWARTFAGQASTSTSGGTTTTTDAVGEGAAVAVDAAGTIFVAGSFTGTVNFGTASAANVLASPGQTAAFVARLDGAGNLVWVQAATTPSAGGDDQANALALDGQGGVVIAGMFERAATFGATTLTSPGASDAFVARYNGAGTVIWAVGSQGTAGSNAQAIGVAVDAASNIALTGFDAGTVSLGSGTSTAQVTAAGSDDALVWKLDPTGKLLWAQSFGSADYDSGGAVAFDPAGDLVVAGTFSDSVNFATAAGGNAAAAATLTAGPIFNAFVLKLDPTGQEVWVRGYLGGTGWSKGQAIAIDPFNQIHVAGAFNGSVDFDPGPASATLTNVGSTDAYAAGLDASGNFVYALQAGQTNFNTVLGLAVNATGAVAIAGTSSGSITFGAISVPASGLASSFVARYQTEPTAVPAIPALEAGSRTGTGTTTSTTAPIFDVATVDPTNVVRLLRDGSTVAQRVGSGALTDPGPVPQGVHQYAAVAVSPAGVVSPASLAITVTILTTPPAAPTALGLVAADDSGYLGDGLTSVRAPRLTGKATAGLTVEIVTSAGTVLGTTTASGDGTFTVALSTLADGTYAVQAVALDAAANASPRSASFSLRILTLPPAAPAAPGLLAADDSGTKGDGTTNVRTPRLTVAAPSGLLMYLFNAAGAVLGMATTSTGGVYTVLITATLADGKYPIRAAALDAAGNLGAFSPATTLVIATALPASLAAPTLLAADDTGTRGDAMTTVRRPRIAGVATPGDEVDWLSASGAVLGATTAASTDGSYVLQPFAALPDGTASVAVRQVDKVGNLGATGPGFSLTIRATTGDSFGDGRTDVAVFRPSTNVFYLWNATQGQVYAKQFAVTGDIPVVGDFFGDGIGDLAIYRPSTAIFAEFDPSTGAVAAQALGTVGDVPVPGDYDGDGKTDVAVFRPGNDTFYVTLSASGAAWFEPWGIPGDIPVPGDYFGNGHTDIAVYRPSNSTFYINDPITGAVLVKNWGIAGDIPVSADYDGDGKTDVAVFRPGNDTFYASLSATNAFLGRPWGTTGDVPVIGSYLGNGRASFNVYRPSNSTFYALDSLSNAVLATQWGIAGDKPIQPPLATNFIFGGGTPKGSAIGPRSFVTQNPPAPPAADFVPDPATSGAVSTPATAAGAGKKLAPTAAIDQAIAALGLDRWRLT